MQTLRSSDIDRYIRLGHAVHIMPERGLVRIDGFRLYRMTDEAIAAARGKS